MRRMTRSSVSEGRGVRALLSLGRIEIVAFLWIVCVLGTLATSSSPEQNPFYTHGRYGKREESYPQGSAFFSGSRYGRSDLSISRGSRTEHKPMEIASRLDRFFPGSRYGKRSFVEENEARRSHHRQSSPKYSSLKRYEEALGYFDRVGHPDRLSRTIDDSRERLPDNDVDKNGDDEEITLEISNEDKLDNLG